MLDRKPLKYTDVTIGDTYDPGLPIRGKLAEEYQASPLTQPDTQTQVETQISVFQFYVFCPTFHR